ncbi:coiled-coil domain-containing protein 28B isoform X1 [Phascolarctos cinereus]|uniref:Coiled-coil domain-containing protein 28B isoform X1 n=1 Tax=Phascolarctos cinereus TaxID=38626 RepID=A0A6P5K243_PHACI|nr:coiled-coil domain-containing protein 28B isoform X1 [Phascolarctos cinereus]
MCPDTHAQTRMLLFVDGDAQGQIEGKLLERPGLLPWLIPQVHPHPSGAKPGPRMDDKKKRRSPKPCLSQPVPPTSALRRVPVPTSRSASFSLGLPHLPSPKQRTKFKRVTKEKCRPVLAGGGGAPAGTPLQHSFLTEVTGVYEMEGGLLNLLNDFHSGRLQAFGKECSFEQLEHVREMQEKLARLHFSLDVCGEEDDDEDEAEAEGLPHEQKKTVADRNLDQLLSNLEDLSNSMYPFLRKRTKAAPGRERRA